MNKDWVKVFIAAFFEVFWVIGLKHADNFWTWTGTFPRKQKKPKRKL